MSKKFSKRLSTFPGMIFNPDDSKLKAGPLSDPMTEGIDPVHLEKMESTLNNLIELKRIPDYYSIHDELSLLPDSVFDTTNRNTVRWAEKDQFDPEGFREGRPLQKPLFYVNPYITCSNCNLVNFIDSFTLRRLMQFPKELRAGIPPESVPPCRQCGRADCYDVGARDYKEEIERRNREEDEKTKRETQAALMIQKNYRLHLCAMYGRAFRQAIIAEKSWYDRAASMIQSVARGRLGRRIYKTKKYLVIIQTAHRSLLDRALNLPSAKKVFWYGTHEEEQVLFDNYLLVVYRTGFHPPRLMVERNIEEIANRIVQRQGMLITLVQRRWRGYMARRVVKLFRYEVIRMRQRWAARVMKIQRVYRGHLGRMLVYKLFTNMRKTFLLTQYKKERTDKKIKAKKELAALRTKNYYLQERAEERSARCLSKVDIASYHGNRRLKAFQTSCYANNQVPLHISGLFKSELLVQKELKNNIEEERRRKGFILNRIKETGPSGFGRRSVPRSKLIEFGKLYDFPLPPTTTTNTSTRELEEGRQDSIEKKSSSNIIHNSKQRVVIPPIKSDKNAINDSYNDECSRSRGMRKLFEKELNTIVENVVTRVAHDFNKKDLLGRFKEHNNRHLDAKYRYRFPKDINENPMDWLEEDIDETVKFQDRKQREKFSL